MRKELDEFLEYLRHGRNASPHTVSAYRIDLLQLQAYLAGRKVSLRDVDAVVLRGFLHEMAAARLAKSSMGRKLAALRSFFEYGVKQGWMEDNPAKVISTPKLDHPVPEFLSEEEMERFLERPDSGAVLGLRDRAILELFYASGIRLSELVGINLDDLNLEERMLRVRGKGRKERLVPFGSKAVTGRGTCASIRTCGFTIRRWASGNDVPSANALAAPTRGDLTSMNRAWQRNTSPKTTARPSWARTWRRS